jgi:hypothetical protein
MDPISAFAAAQTAIGLIRKGVEFYKECKSTGSDVMEITSEVTDHIGKFMAASEVVKEAAEKAKTEVPKKGKSVNAQALENVMMARQIFQAETELREMLIYQAPGLGAIWTEFEKERARLKKVQDQQEIEEQEEKERLSRIAEAKARRRKESLKKLIDESVIGVAVLLVIVFYLGMLYLVVDYRREHYPEYGDKIIPQLQPNWKQYEIDYMKQLLDQREERLRQLEELNRLPSETVNTP